MIHTRQHNTRESIDLIPHPQQYANQSVATIWEGITHEALLYKIEGFAEDRKWTLDNFTCHLAGPHKEGMAACWDIRRPEEPPKGTIYCIGVVHSNDKRHGMRLMGGVRIPSMHSSVVLSEYTLGKHTSYKITQLDNEIHKIFVTFARESRSYHKMIAALDDIRLNPSEINDLLMTAGRAKLMGPSRVGQTDKLFSRMEPTAWNLLKCFGVGLKKGEPLLQMPRGYTFTRMAESCQRNR